MAAALPALLIASLLTTAHPAARAAAPPAPAAGPARGVAVVGVEPVGRPNAGNAALFVGVNEFEDPSLRALRFAVNDSVAQAHLFVLELKLVPPANTVLLLAGEPTSASARAQLTALKDAGVRVERAMRSRLFTELLRVVQLPQESADLVIVSLSSHGFEEGGVPYVIPTDGTRGALGDTGFSLKTVEDRLGRSKAGKRLLIVDACREKATGDDKNLGTAMDRAWRQALAQSAGQAVLASCDVGQFSFEDVKLGHGVFTHHLLEALGGKAAADARGYITLGAVSDHVAKAVNEWVSRNKVGTTTETAQKPWFKGPNDARDMPLAVSRAMLGMQRELAARKVAAQEKLADAYKAQNKVLTARLLEEIERGLEALAGEKLEELLEQVGELATPTVARVKAFVGWWEGRGRVLAGLVPVPEPGQPAGSTPGEATRERPFVNSLGMKFVPVPGTPVLFGVWHVRVQDFTVFAQATGHDPGTNMYSLKADGWKPRGATWKSPGFAQGPTHPVSGVSWEDAQGSPGSCRTTCSRS